MSYARRAADGVNGRSNPHLAEAGNIESLGGREDVVDPPTNGIIRRTVDLHVLHVVVRLVHRLGCGRWMAVLCRSGLAPTACRCQLRSRAFFRRHRTANDLWTVRRTQGMRRRQTRESRAAFVHGAEDTPRESATPPRMSGVMKSERRLRSGCICTARVRGTVPRGEIVTAVFRRTGACQNATNQRRPM